MSSPTFPFSLSPMSRLPISLFLSLSLAHLLTTLSLTHPLPYIFLHTSSFSHVLLLCITSPSFAWICPLFLMLLPSFGLRLSLLSSRLPCSLSSLGLVGYHTLFHHLLRSCLSLTPLLNFYAFPVHLTLMVRTFTTSTRRTRHRRPRRSIGTTTIGGPSSSSTTSPPTNGTRLRWLYTSSSSICFAGWFIMSSPSILMACLI